MWRITVPPRSFISFLLSFCTFSNCQHEPRLRPANGWGGIPGPKWASGGCPQRRFHSSKHHCCPQCCPDEHTPHGNHARVVCPLDVVPSSDGSYLHFLLQHIWHHRHDLVADVLCGSQNKGFWPVRLGQSYGAEIFWIFIPANAIHNLVQCNPRVNKTPMSEAKVIRDSRPVVLVWILLKAFVV